MSLSADVAIGAPFAGPDQRGKVLIYNGNQHGLRSEPSQILQGVWASETVPPGFGFTLRGDADIDKNDYPGKVFFLFPRESPLPRTGPFSGKCIMCEQLSQTGEGQACPRPGILCTVPEWLFMRIWRQTKQTLPFPSRKARWLFKNCIGPTIMSTLQQKFLFESRL